MPIALQLYTVRNQLARDPAATLRRVRDIGYRTVETYPFDPAAPEISVKKVAELLNELELQVVAMHCELPIAGASLTGVLEAAAAFNCKRAIWHGWPKREEFCSVEGVRALVARYNQAHALAREHGLELGLHNHWWEFELLQGVYPYQIFHELLHPEIFFEIDTYWAQTAGRNPASVVRELGPRVKLLHLKDGPAIHGAPMIALGGGVLDFPSILGALAKPVDLVVEFDECATDIFTAIDQSLGYLRRLT
jgi:sugar phosphate isomerase/epimerase